MSLINDALKRAQRAQQQQTRDVAADPPLQPAESQPVNRVFPWILPAMLALISVLACGLLWVGWRKTAEKPQITTELASAAATPLVLRQDATLPNAAVGQDATLLDAIVGQDATLLDAIVGQDAPAQYTGAGQELALIPAEPEFKLQGIYFRMSGPSAMINGHTLLVGEEIDGARIVGIERHAVRIVAGGTTNVLRMR
jgi:hypothetical protein